MAVDLITLSLTVAGHQLEDVANGYEVIAYGRGDSQLRRHTKEGDDIPGRLLLSWTEDTMLGSIVVRVRGANANQIGSRLDTLIGWFRGVDYVVAATVAHPDSSGSTWVEQWKCEPADYSLSGNGELDPVLLNSLRQDVHFTWPHDPVQV